MTTQAVGIQREALLIAPRPEQNSTVREKLQQHTHGFHTRLSHHPLLLGLTRPGYPLLDYTKILLVYHRFYRQVEDEIEAGLRHFKLPCHSEKRRRLPWLAADLRHFQIEPETANQADAPSSVVQEIDSPGKIVGTLYAIEGSALGGQVVLRHLAENLGLTGATGARFFQGYGADTLLRWREFCAFAECFGEKPEALQEAKFAAADVFITLKTLLDSGHEQHPL